MFPSLYHAHHSLNSEDIHFWLDLAAQCPNPVLELGCGTGRVLLPLARMGNRVFGMDIAWDMLAFLKQSLSKELHATAFIFQADFARFKLSSQFGLIILPCNTLSTLRLENLRSLLTCVHDHLQPGGIFAASIPNPFVLQSLRTESNPEIEETFPSPIDGEPIQVSSSWNRTKSHLIIHWFYDHLIPDGSIERISTQVQHNLIGPEIYGEEISKAGFETHIMYGDFDRSDFYSDSPYCIFLAS